jgi:carbon-monoxide dehydrogenase large subunit
MDASPEDLEFEDGRIYVRGSPDRGMTFTEVVEEAYRGNKLPPGEEPGLEAEAAFDPSNFTFPFGTCVAMVEIDMETGAVRLRRYVSVDDCGRVINPLLVEGQIHGGITQGVAQALWEEAIYDENGRLVTGSFMDYAMPTAAVLPRFELDRTETPSPANPLGAKGIGEAGTIAATPAVVNAVVDALRHLGIRHIDMPLKPERVWRALQAAQGGE